MNKVVITTLGAVATLALSRWYGQEQVREGTAKVAWQSEHAHLHLHVDLPPGMAVQAGDTLEILQMPAQTYTDGEEIYTSGVRLHKASWLRRQVIERSSLIEVKEIVEHP